MKNLKLINTFDPKVARRYTKIVHALITLIFLVSLSSPTLAQVPDLDDFKACAGQDGVASIPFVRERNAAQSAENAKKSAESEAKSKFGVSALTTNLTNAQKKVTSERKVLAAAEKDLADAKKYHPTVIDKEEKALKASKDKLEDYEEEVEDAYEEIEYGMNHWKQLAVSRGKVRIAFDNAIDELNDAERNPERHIGKKPSDPEALKKWNADLALLKGYINTIRGELVKGQVGHKEAEDGANDAVKNLDKL